MRKKIVTALFLACGIGLVAGAAVKFDALSRLKLVAEHMTVGGPRAKTPQQPSENKNTPMQARIVRALLDLQVDAGDLQVDSLARDSVTIRARVPLGIPMEQAIWRLHKAAEKSPGTVSDVYLEKKRETWHVIVDSRRNKRFHLKLIRGNRFYFPTGRMAIVVEDFSFAPNQVTVDFLSFPEPLSVVVVAAGKQSSWAAQIAGEYKKEIVLGIPMESQAWNSGLTSPDAIMIHHTDDQIRAAVGDAMRAIPNFSGFTNRLGSRALEDTRATRIVCGEVRRRHGYFLETPATPRSVAQSVCVSLEIPYAGLHEQIDKKASRSAVETRLQQLAVVAQSRGRLVVGVPATGNAVAALRNRLQFFRDNGIALVLVSQIVRRTFDHPITKGASDGDIGG